MLCPRYEGVDERIRVDGGPGAVASATTFSPAARSRPWSSIDTILRLLPGAIDAESIAEESFAAGLLEYPQYTRPPDFDGVTVPSVLTSGHHEAVRKWRLKEALRRTLARRPELLEGRPLD